MNKGKPSPEFVVVVLLALGIFAWVVFPGGTTESTKQKARFMATLNTMNDLSAGVSNFVNDCGKCPVDLSALQVNPGIAGWHGPYVRTNMPLVDLWLTPFQYSASASSFSIRSAGSDRKFGTPDDIVR